MVLKALPDIKEDGPGTHLSAWDNRCGVDVGRAQSLQRERVPLNRNVPP